MNIERWMKEVRRLMLAAGDQGWRTTQAREGAVSLAHGEQASVSQGQREAARAAGKAIKLVWRASCADVAVEGDSPEEAMRGLLRKLEKNLEDMIRKRREELSRLERAHASTLHAVPDPKKSDPN